MAPRVGFLGLGIMGKQMASLLLKQNVEVCVWNRTASKCAPLVAEGATTAATPAEVISSCDVTHAMLADPRASESVVFGAGGILSAARSTPFSYIDHSTVDEATGKKISDAVTSTGARFLAAPVSGGWRDAAKGELLMICGGDRSLFDEASADGAPMQRMGHKQWFTGDSPAGAARAKLMLQVMMGTYIGALGEMIALTEKTGVDPSRFLARAERRTQDEGRRQASTHENGFPDRARRGGDRRYPGARHRRAGVADRRVALLGQELDER